MALRVRRARDLFSERLLVTERGVKCEMHKNDHKRFKEVEPEVAARVVRKKDHEQVCV